jgi:hypothetical protein
MRRELRHLYSVPKQYVGSYITVISFKSLLNWVECKCIKRKQEAISGNQEFSAPHFATLFIQRFLISSFPHLLPRKPRDWCSPQPPILAETPIILYCVGLVGFR